MGIRFTQFYSFATSLYLVSSVALVGCSTTTPEAPRVPEPTEKVVFDAVTSFYCAEKRWPATWDELIQFEGLSTEAHSAVGEMLTPSLSSPRALLLVVRYKNIQGADRKVTYIAPPECGPLDDPSRASMVGGRVVFTKPKGFELMKGAEIKTKWKDGPYPDVAWQDASKSVFVTVSFGEVQIEPTELAGLKEELELAYQSSLPNLVWIERSLAADEEPPKLIHMLSSEGATGTALTYSMSMSFDGRLLTIAVLGSGAKEREVEAVGNALRRSLTLR